MIVQNSGMGIDISLVVFFNQQLTLTFIQTIFVLTRFQMMCDSEFVKPFLQMTGKLKDGHNPYTRSCMKNFQIVLCGPTWPK